MAFGSDVHGFVINENVGTARTIFYIIPKNIIHIHVYSFFIVYTRVIPS